MSLRTRLLVGYLVFLGALAALGGWSVWRLEEVGAVAHRILSENYESVVAAQNMKESLERQDSAALFALLGRTEPGPPAAPGTSAALRRRVRARREQPHRAG